MNPKLMRQYSDILNEADPTMAGQAQGWRNYTKGKPTTLPTTSPAPGVKVTPAAITKTSPAVGQGAKPATRTAKPSAPKPIPNPNQAAVDAANRVQAGQTAAVQGQAPTDRFAGQAKTDAQTGQNNLGVAATPAAAPADNTVDAAVGAGQSLSAMGAAQKQQDSQADFQRLAGITPTVTPEPAAQSTTPVGLASATTSQGQGEGGTPPESGQSAKPATAGTPVTSSSGQPIKTGSGGTLTSRAFDEDADEEVDQDDGWDASQQNTYDEFMRKMDLARVQRAWEKGERAPGTIDLDPIAPETIDIREPEQASTPPAKPGVFSNIDAFIQQGKTKSSPTAKTASADSREVTSGTPGSTWSTGTGSKLTTRSADELDSGPQSYYKRMMRPGQNEDKDMSELMKLSGLLNEKAVSKQQQKFMGMVHAMQKGKKIKGASPELKKVAKTMSKKAAHDYAATKHKGLPQRVNESVMLEAGNNLEHIVQRFKHETKNFLNGGMLDDDLYNALYDYYLDNGEMPYGVAKAREGDPYQWVEQHFEDALAMMGHMRQFQETAMPVVDNQLSELARLAGLSESRVDECGDMGMGQEDSLNVSTNMSSDGKKNVTISAQGQDAEALIQMLKLAGMGSMGHDVSSDDEMMEEAGSIQVHDLSSMDDGSAYDETQVSDEIHDGDVLITRSGVGLMVKAWPVIVVGDSSSFHKLKPGTSWDEFEGGKYAESARKAMEVSGQGSLDEASSQRLIKKLGDAVAGAKIYKDMDWGEYIVKFIKDGKMLPEETWHHTDDLEDAMGTAENEIARMSSLEEEYANSPDEEYETVAAITRQGNDLNREKRQYADRPKLGDNPMAEDALDEELQGLLDSVLIKADEGLMSQYPDVLGPASGISPEEAKADQARTARAQAWNRRETARQAANVPAPGAKVPSPDEGPVTKAARPPQSIKPAGAK